MSTKTKDKRETVEVPCRMGRDPWHCATHDSAWDIAKRCQKASGEPEPRRA